MKSMRQQRGAALVIALLIMTICLTVATNMLFRQQLSSRLAANIGQLEQAYQYATALEDWSRTILERDATDSAESDDLTEVWATDLPPIPIPGGSLTAKLTDLQSSLNVNMLFPPEVPLDQDIQADASISAEEKQRLLADRARYLIVRERLVRLFENLDADEKLGPAETFVDILEDWMDEDNDTLSGGAESDHYIGQDPAYYAANRPFVNTSEFRLLKNVDKDSYPLIQHLTALPEKETSVNVNTASEEVLKALGFSAEATENIISLREEEPFKSMQDFTDLAVVQTATTPGADGAPEVYSQYLSNTTDFFQLTGEINIGDARVFINSLMWRNDGKVSIVSRNFSKKPYSPPKEPE